MLGRGDCCDALRGPGRAGEKGRGTHERKETNGRITVAHPLHPRNCFKWSRLGPPCKGFHGPAQVFPTPFPRVTHSLSSSPLGAAAIFFAAKNPRGGRGKTEPERKPGQPGSAHLAAIGCWRPSLRSPSQNDWPVFLYTGEAALLLAAVRIGGKRCQLQRYEVGRGQILTLFLIGLCRLFVYR